jgi:hypothetical protein
MSFFLVQLAIKRMGSHSKRACFLALPFLLLLGCTEPTATRTGTGGIGGSSLTAVYSRTHGGYSRTQLADGSFVPETYAFWNGGNFGGPRVDPTMDRLSFDAISRVIAIPLAAQNYIPSDEPSNTKLLIVVYWGVTIVPNDVQPFSARESQQLRDQASNIANTTTGHSNVGHPQSFADADEFSYIEASSDGRIDAVSSNILGYTDEIERTSLHDPHMLTLQQEVENDRYYVVLLAYDYQLGRKFGLHKLLWETRFSIPERGNDFDKAFPGMASIAGKYFGVDSPGLVHAQLGETHVEIGEPKSLGVVPEK